MPYQVTFIQERDGPGAQESTQTTGVVTKNVNIGDRCTLIGEDGWWVVVESHELPWVPIHKWDVGGVTTRRQ